MVNLSNNLVDPEINEQSYLKFLMLAQKKSYKFIFFDEFNKHSKFIILRHDLDFDLNFAIKLAQIEHQKNVKSTYFIMLHHPLYNIWTKSNQLILKKIINLGHTIGLHFDLAFYNSKINNQKLLNFYIEEELSFLSKITNSKIYFVSFHQPQAEILQNQIYLKDRFESVYNKIYFIDIKYISDSTGRWCEASINKFLQESKFDKIQFLSHPALWLTKQKKLKARLEKILFERKSRMDQEFKDCINNYQKGIILDK